MFLRFININLDCVARPANGEEISNCLGGLEDEKRVREKWSNNFKTLPQIQIVISVKHLFVLQSINGKVDATSGSVVQTGSFSGLHCDKVTHKLK